MKQKTASITTILIIAISILVLSVLVTNSVFASAPAPAPKCSIKGIIQSVDFKKAYNESCLTDCPIGEWCCPTDMELEHPDRYFLNVTIKEVEYIEGTTEFSTCEELFPINKEKTIFINKANVNEGDVFKPNKQIDGQTSPYEGVDYLESYTLKEPGDSNTKTEMYVAIVIISIILIITIIYFLRKNKK